VMTIGGTAAAALGGLTALLTYQAERQSFAAAAAIRRQKDALEAALARVESLLDERREMVAMVAHDLQSPLAGIRALLQTMSEASASDAGKLEVISRTCAQMHGAIAGLIAAHAAEAAAEPELETVEVDALFARAVAAAAALAAEKGITVESADHGCRVRTEPAMIGGMLDNLLSNALKFSPAGSLVRLDAERFGTQVRLSVSDRGPGISPDEAPLLFQKFARLSAKPTGGEPSSGLGLYIVRTQAERIGARVGVEPNPAGGSSFFIDLPSAVTEEA
jgi:signal transduction histidine kinase